MKIPWERGAGELIFPRAAWSLITASLLLCAQGAGAITCEECREMDKKRSLLAQEISQKDKDLTAAFDKKQFKKVTQMRSEVTALRKKYLEFKGSEEECKKACRPDAIKNGECRKIMVDIVKLEDAEEVNTEKVDSLYRDLYKCKKELEQLKKGEK
jgi:hypothetical protein